MSEQKIKAMIDDLEDGMYLPIKDKHGKLLTAFYKKCGKLYRYNDCIMSREVENVADPLGTYQLSDIDFETATCSVHSQKSFIYVVKDEIRRLMLERFSSVDETLLSFVKHVNEDRFKFVTFGGSDIGILMCLTSTDEDFYYCYIGKDLCPHFSSSVGRYYIVDENELSLDYSMLKYMLENEKETLIEKVLDFVDNNVDVVISKLTV